MSSGPLTTDLQGFFIKDIMRTCSKNIYARRDVEKFKMSVFHLEFAAFLIGLLLRRYFWN